MKSKISLSLLVFSIFAAGCSVDEVLDLGPTCPGLSTIKQLNGNSCNPGSDDNECKNYIKDKAFEASRCPINFRCVQSDSNSFCYCQVPCENECCEEGTVCNTFYKKCVPVNPGVCQNDEECLTQDHAKPYCENSQCVECRVDDECSDDEFCYNNRCIECKDDADCSEPLVCSHNRCVACLDDYEPSCTTESRIRFCSEGLIRETECPSNAPICKDGVCIGCQSDSDCVHDNTTGYCINNRCIDCIQDSDCSGTTPYCRNNQCVSCASDDDCQDEVNTAAGTTTCAKSLGTCVQCDPEIYKQNCSGKTFNQCIDYQLESTQCALACDESTENGCVACTTDDDCADSDGRPFCFENECVQCREVADENQQVNDCEEPKQCNANHVCADCLSDDDCADNTDGKKLCHPDKGICVECKAKSTCTGSTPLCDEEKNICVAACTDDTSCPAGTQCFSGNCVDIPTDGNCFRNEHCNDDTKPICNAQTDQFGKCVGCLNDQNCKDAGRGQICNTNTNTCLGCTSNEHCTDGKKCDNVSNKCVECLGEEIVCSGNTLKKCENQTWKNQECGDVGCSVEKKACNNCVNGDVKGCDNDGKSRIVCVNDAYNPVMCTGDTPFCVNGQCVQCNFAGDKCENSVVYTCNGGVKTPKNTCGNKGCNSDGTACNQCESTYVSCSGNTLTTCSGGNYKTTNCPYGCEGNACANPECSFTGSRCNGSALENCSNGKFSSVTCPNGCSNNQCIQKVTYSYLRINDLSPASGTTDIGSDIDAVVHIRNGAIIGYASRVVSANCASDQSAMIGAPDALYQYPGNTTVCHARNNGGSGSGPMLYSSLGGTNCYAILEMSNKIQSGDRLDVLEVGNCSLTYTIDGKTYSASGDTIQVLLLQSQYDSGLSLGSKSTSPVMTFYANY